MRMPQTEEIGCRAIVVATDLPDIPPTQQPPQFDRIEPMLAYDAAIQQQHGDIEAMATL